MTKPFPPRPDDDEVTGLPRTVAEAVNELVYTLEQAEKDEIAAMPQHALINLHSGLGERIREDFGLHEENPALLASSRQTNADDASMVIIRALWARLRH
jgi:hypothetical protein